MHLINRLKTIHLATSLAASLATILATILFLGVATPAFAERINECEPLFDSSNAEVMTSPELGTVSLDSATAKVEPRSSFSPDFIPANSRLRSLKFSEWTLPTSSKDPKFKASMNELLEMMTETHFENVDPKMTIEKGELHLARSIGDGETIEFEYRRDSRHDSFRLDKIVLYKPNGQPILIDKSPISDNGLHFSRDTVLLVENSELYEGRTSLASLHPLELSELSAWAHGRTIIEQSLTSKKSNDPGKVLQNLASELSPADQVTLAQLREQPEALKVPIVIEGDLLKAITAWAGRMPNLPRGKVKAAIRDNHVTRLIWTTRLSSSMKIVANTTRKQVAKWVVIGALILGIQQAPHELDFVRSALPGNLISKLTGKHDQHLDSEQAEIVLEVLARLKQQAAGIPTPVQENRTLSHTGINVPNRGGQETPETQVGAQLNSAQTVSNLTEAVSQLSADEKAHGGQITFYMSDLQNHQTSILNAGTLQAAEQQVKSGYLIAVFPNTQKVILAPITVGADSMSPRVATILIERQSQTQIYDVIVNNLIHP